MPPAPKDSGGKSAAVAEAQRKKKMRDSGISSIPERVPAPTVIDPFTPGFRARDPIKKA